jgi:signal transduction histidine kinase
MRLFFTGLLTLFSSVGFAQTGLPLLTFYKTNLSDQKSIYSIVQDNTGIIYIATGERIIQFDGVEFTTVSDTPAYGLLKDSSGIIYVSGNNEFGYLESSPTGKVSYKSLMNLLDSDGKLLRAERLYATKDKVYCNGGKVILEYDKKSGSVIPYQTEPGSNFYDGFVKNDTLWISVCNRGLRYLKDGKIQSSPNGDSFLKFQRSCMNCSLTFPHDQNILIFGETLVRYSGSKPEPIPFHVRSNVLAGSAVQNSISINNTYHLIYTVKKGAILMDTLGYVLNHYCDSTRLPSNNVSFAYQDQTGNLWLAFENSRNPIVKTEHGQDISLWDKNTNLTGGVLSMSRFHNVTYVSTDNGLYYVNKDGRVNKFYTPDQYRFKSLTAFTTSQGDKLMAVFSANRICEIKNGKIKELYKGFDINQIIQSKKNPSLLYVSDLDKLGYLLYADEEWTYHEVTKLSEYMSLLEDPDGSLWLSNNNKSALFHIIPKDENHVFELKAIERYTIKNGLPGKFCQPVWFNNQVLFGTKSGVYSFDATTSKFMPWHKVGRTLYDLLSRASLIISDQPNRFIHLIVDKKLVTLSAPPKGDTVLIYKPYRRFSELGSITNLLIDETGALWATSIDGVIRYDRKKDLKNYEQDFSCLIRKVVVGKDSTVFWGGLDAAESRTLKVSLNHGFEKLTIRFAAPFFDKEEETLYSYQLVGRDVQWSEWSHTTTKEYENLQEGTYTFRVKAKNIYDTESSEASFSFVIHPPWVRTWWAYAVYVGLALLAMTSIVRWRTKNLSDKKKHLENLVNAQTRELREFNKSLKESQEELQRSNEELLTTNDYLKKAQKQLVESEKMASLGQLTAGIAHEINNPINFISGGVQALWSVQKELFARGPSMPPEVLAQIENDTFTLMQSINNGVSRTAEIIRSLRTFYSPDETIDAHGKVNVKDCIESSLVLLGSKINRENIIVTKDYQHRSGAKANSSQISQVLINLLDNAIYELAKIDKARQILITTRESDAEISIKIKDNAGGIPEEIQGHIFEPFFTTKKVGSGTGLGLSLCYSIIVKHKGKIFFTSTPGEGTEFTITLPRGEGDGNN